MGQDGPHASGNEEAAISSRKIDPRLLEALERSELVGAADHDLVDVIVGLRRTIDGEVRNELQSRGLALRSEIGDIATGRIEIGQLRRLARSRQVVTIEGGPSMSLENTGNEYSEESTPNDGLPFD